MTDGTGGFAIFNGIRASLVILASTEEDLGKIRLGTIITNRRRMAYHISRAPFLIFALLMGSSSSPASDQSHVPRRAHHSLSIATVVSLYGGHNSVLRFLFGAGLDELTIGAILQ